MALYLSESSFNAWSTTDIFLSLLILPKHLAWDLAGGTKEPEVPDKQFCLAWGRKWDVSKLSPIWPGGTPTKLTPMALG